LRQAIQDGLEVGDIEFACHTADFYCAHLFFVGEHLEFVADRLEQYMDFVNKFKQEYHLNLLKIFGQAVSNLRGNSENKCKLIGNNFNELEKLPQFIEEQNVIYLLYLYFFKSSLCYLFKDYYGCLKNAELAAQYSHFIRNIVLFFEHIFYYLLALIARYANNFFSG
jgi:predicted ATPase